MRRALPPVLAPALAALIVGLAALSARAAEPAPPPPAKSSKPAPTRATALVARMTIKVIHPEEVRTELIGLAAKSGGHITLLTDFELHLKLPPAALDALMKAAAGKGAVIDKNLSRTDLTESISQLRGKVRSKTEILERLRGFVDDSNVGATLKIERVMTRLVRELEGVKGRLRVAQERARWATLNIAFRYRKRGRIKYVRSPFAWLNTVDLDLFVRSF